MDLNKLYSATRTNYNGSHKSDQRTEFQRDFDRIIFSSPFRRLQNKTQVFPLPGSVFVHNRLTHSLEVASVGRSLGSLAGSFIAQKFDADLTDESKEFYKYSLDSVIAAACLCHDIGNPAFGHSGEDAIASYFIKHQGELKEKFSEDEWKDFINFEGNANAIRVLTQQQNGKSGGSFNLTSSTLSAIAKYPCQSSAKNKKILHRKKFGFFQSEINVFEEMAANTSMIKEADSPVQYKRHPFVWLVEAADDICYHIIDLEDAHRLSIVESHLCLQLLVDLIVSLGADDKSRLETRLQEIKNKNEKVSYLRAKAISVLIGKAIEIYTRDFDAILTGDYDTSIFDSIGKQSPVIRQIVDVSVEFIYNHRSVVEIENAGYNVMSELLSHFIPPVLAAKDAVSKAQDKAIKLLPEQFRYKEGSNYEKVMGVLDYVSGMTDNYATDLYRKIKGIEIGMTV
ncbi:dGTP triphosphohydrolase [Ferruginibacter sp. HRS2-29]|uniref:dGTP triphosphohydrolase n=1 Tax=Ferruginibacter sp. HRS2-29 TaxID=2487334 RepID=UPI0020CB73C6|nr:dNTP triphosphohydrolase [Ferruginibacter sp. HRS2-29]MCP9752815.1 dNTP triphosphohydrolase [Ferruginibacter sp. HRS2-29]